MAEALQTPGIADKATEENKPEAKPLKGKWNGPPGSINLAGRPKANATGKDTEKKSNKQLRMEAMMHLARMLRPHLAKSIQAAAKIIGNEEASDQNKLKAAVFITGLYKSLLEQAYHHNYDDDAGEELQQKPGAVFSMRVLNTEGANE